ncbi:hypothetical protein LguiA_017405 [Lonicera macranthoides]
MSGREEDSDSDAPEEFTAEQAIQRDEEIQKVQKENKARIVREGKERRRQWAQKLTPRQSRSDKKSTTEVTETEAPEESQDNKGMLSEDIVKLLAAREKYDILLYACMCNGSFSIISQRLVIYLYLRGNILTCRKVFLSDSEEEETEKKPTSKKKKPKSFGVEPVILSEIPPSHCLQSSLEFLKKRKMQVARSSAVLNNSNKALRLLSTSGLLSKK